MAELTHYRCPNCGASITNTENCEYCGSLLVRFAKRGIDLTKTSYLSNDKVYPGLIENLKRNLQLQHAFLGKEAVVTDILQSKERSTKTKWNKNGYICSVVPIAASLFGDGQKIFPNITNEIGLCIAISFDAYLSGFDEYNQKYDERLERFQKLDSFPLFMSHQCYYTDRMGHKRKGREYAINFGCDAEGAARLISEIIQKVYLIPHEEKIEIFTNHGLAIEETRISVMKERGFDTSEYEKNLENRRNEGCYVATAVYGSYDCPSVWTLRRYRDYTLDKTFAGRAFIKAYYAISPTLVRWFSNSKWFKGMCKPVLDGMVSKLQKKGVESTPYKDKY